MKSWPRPALSIVVVVYNMDREARRTLYSLSTKYQHGVTGRDYEVIVIDNGSAPPFPVGYLQTLEGRFEYFYIDDARPSPAAAVNFGVRRSRGEYVGIM